MNFAAAFLACVVNCTEVKTDKVFVVGAASAAALQTTDLVQTWHGTQLNTLHEGNPLARPFVSSGPKFTAFSVAVVTTTAVGLALTHRHHPKVARVAAWAIVAAETLVVVHNARVIGRQR